VVREGADGRNHRLTTLSAAGTSGELALVDRRARAADVRADSEVECRTLPYATIDAWPSGTRLCTRGSCAICSASWSRHCTS
jgi:hypothetical protein